MTHGRVRFRLPSLVVRLNARRWLLVIGALVIGWLLACLPGEPAPPTFTLAFGGDVMLGRGVAQSLDGDWQSAFSAVRSWLADADLAFANLESPLTTAPQVSSGYDLRASPAAAQALRTAGFDLVSLANNHALDAGDAGLAETVATLDAAGITGVVTQGLSGKWVRGGQQSAAGLLSSGNTRSFQVVSQTTDDWRQTVRYHLLAFDDSLLPLDVDAATQQVAKARQHADLVIVSVHWGGEYQAAPSLRQQAIAQELAFAGADLVVGHGPHVLQRVEWAGKALVAYSLGNLLFDQPYPLDCRQGVILRVTRSVRGSLAFELLPTVTEEGRVRRANANEAQTILSRLLP